MLEKLFAEFDRIIVLDTETTGIRPERDEIIELGFLCRNPAGEETKEDHLIRLSEGRSLPAEITRLTGITAEMLSADGVTKETAADALVRSLECEHPLVAAYNAQFDLQFLYYFLARLGREKVLRRCRFLDILSVYKDRHDYPHRLENAVEVYAAEGENTHRAVDDAVAALAVLEAMERERDDLHHYINLFGYNPKYGVSGKRIGSIRYEPQPYQRTKLLYE